MLKKLIGILALALMLSPAVAMATTWDDGSGTDHDWSTGANWDTNNVPTSTDQAYLKGAGAGVTDITANNATCSILWNAFIWTPNTLEHWTTIHSGGKLTVVDKAYLTLFNGGPGHWDLSGVTVKSGGQLVVGTDMWNCWQSGSFKMSGVLDTSGTITVGGTYSVSCPGDYSHGTTHLRAGTITCGDFVMDANWPAPPWDLPSDSMDIEAGILYISGDKTVKVGGYITNGYITAYGGTGIVSNLYEAGLNRTKVWATPIPEPGTMLLAGFGVLALLLSRRKR